MWINFVLLKGFPPIFIAFEKKIWKNENYADIISKKIELNDNGIRLMIGIMWFGNW